MHWHLIDGKGRIVRSVRARTKADAKAILGAGTIVSDASWRLDVHKWKPVETVITGIIQPLAAKRRPPMPKGYVTVKQAAARLSLTERQVHNLLERSQMRVAQFDRGRYGFTERQLIQLAQMSVRSSTQSRQAVAKRVAGYLEHCRARILARLKTAP